MNSNQARPFAKANPPRVLHYAFCYGQKQVLLSGKTTIDSDFLNHNFNIILEGDMDGDLISIETLPNKKGLIIKKLTFKLTVENRDRGDSHWKTMLSSDIVDVIDQQEIKIQQYCFKIEVQKADPGSNQYQREASREEIQQRIMKSNSRESYKDNLACQEMEDAKEEKSQDIWDYYKAILNEDYFWDAETKWNNSKGFTESTNFTNNYQRTDSNRQSQSLSYSSNMQSEKNSQIGLQFSHKSDIGGSNRFDKAQGINSKPGQKKTSEFFEPNIQKKTVITKQRSTDSFLDSPPVGNDKRNKQKWNADTNEGEDGSVPKMMKKVRKDENRLDQKAHERIQRHLSDSSIEFQSSKKKVMRRKKLNIDEEDDVPNQVNSVMAQTKYDERNSHKDSFDESEMADLNSGIKPNSQSKRGQTFDEEDEGDKTKGKLSSQHLTRRSSLSDNQLKRLKKLVVDKRDAAAAKKEPEKVDPSHSPKSKEACSICLTEIKGEVGRLDGCVHTFCFSCIEDWSKVANECPLCRKRFSQITKYSADNTKQETRQIEYKIQRYDGDLEDIPAEEETDDSCYACRRDNNPDVLLICDQCHYYCCHTYCCDPPLSSVPEGDWICVFCEEENENEFIDDSYSQPLDNSLYRLRFPARRRGEQPTLLERLFEQADDISNNEDNQVLSQVSSYDELEPHYRISNRGGSHNLNRRNIGNSNHSGRNRTNHSGRNRTNQSIRNRNYF